MISLVGEGFFCWYNEVGRVNARTGDKASVGLTVDLDITKEVNKYLLIMIKFQDNYSYYFIYHSEYCGLIAYLFLSCLFLWNSRHLMIVPNLSIQF